MVNPDRVSDGEVGQTLLSGPDFSPGQARQPQQPAGPERQRAVLGQQLAVAVHDVQKDVEIGASMRIDPVPGLRRMMLASSCRRLI